MAKTLSAVEGLRPVPAAGCICFRGDEVLLVKRGQAPRAGEWSIPGGRIEPGETAKAAALRELFEETGVKAKMIGLVDVVDAIFRNRDETLLTRHYVLVDYAARWVSGEPVAGDDADKARFVPVEALENYSIWGETERVVKAAYALYKRAN